MGFSRSIFFYILHFFDESKNKCLKYFKPLNVIIVGQIDFFDPAFDSEMIFKGCGALVFVIDARDDYIEALTKLNKTVLKAHAVNKQIKFEVFIHKVDGISDDLKMETQRDIHQRATDDLVSDYYRLGVPGLECKLDCLF